MHILISCFGSAGDVHPFIAIGQALRERGHRVELLSSPYFGARIAAAGLGFVPIGHLDDYQNAVAEPDLWHPRRSFGLLWYYLECNLREAYQAIVDRSESDTILVGSTLAWNCRLAQEKLGLPAATVHLSPSCVFSSHDPAIWPHLALLQHLPPPLVRLIQRAIERYFLDPIVVPDLNKLRADLHLPPVHQIMSTWLNSPQRVICAFPEWFAPAQPDWPAHSVSTGFPLWMTSAKTSLDPALEQFLQSGPAPVGITFGSAMAHGRVVFERALKACEALGLRAVVITPYRDQLPRPLPAFAQHVDYAPFDLLLPRLGAFVHHGGIGTLAQSLRAGVPQLIVPFAHDQFDNAARAGKLGVAHSIAADSRPARWVDALRALTSQARFADHCAQWAKQIRPLNSGAVQIAEQIESLQRAAVPGAAFPRTAFH